MLRTVAYSGAGSALWALLPAIAAQQLSHRIRLGHVVRLAGQKQVLATVRSPTAEVHCPEGEATQIDWQDAVGWPTLVFHPP